MKREFLWVEKYRPHKIDECILPDGSKKSFQGFLTQGEIPNLLLSGPAGVGKTTVARALCDEIGASYLLINGSDEGRSIDTIRNKVKQFATSVSLTSSAAHKVVILDEADNMTYDVQMILRAAIEEYHINCRFIFTCNFINKLIDPIKSRCTVVDFTIKPSHKEKLQEQFFYRIRDILTKNQLSMMIRLLLNLSKDIIQIGDVF